MAGEQIITTEGFVVDERSQAEAAAVLSIFTRDLGLVYVQAAGIRYEKSKLRYHTQLYSLATYSFVPGREYLRLVGAENKQIPSSPITSLAKVAYLIKRFVGQNEPIPELFDWLVNNKEEDPYLSLSILRRLGYVAKEPKSLQEASWLLQEAVSASQL